MSEVKNIDRDKSILNSFESGKSWSQIANEFEISISTARSAYKRAKTCRHYQVYLQDSITKKIPVFSCCVTGDFLEAVVLAIKRNPALQALTLPSWEFISDTSESLKITDAWQEIAKKNLRI